MINFMPNTTSSPFIRSSSLLIWVKTPLLLPGAGAAAETRAPIDRFAEIVDGKHGIWITGYSTLFIRDMLGPDTYFYMGGNSWGVGIDYELDFKPDFSGAPFWLTACTSRVYGLSGRRILQC